MNEIRVTKFSFRSRELSGAGGREEWTSFGDIGRTFDGVELTPGDYQRIEDAYVSAALAFLRESAVSHLTVRGLENAQGGHVPVNEGDVLPVEQISDVLRRVLREEFWCRLEATDAFVHVGWDFYMYLGVPRPCPVARQATEELGLYVDDFPSPYRSDLVAE